MGSLDSNPSVAASPTTIVPQFNPLDIEEFRRTAHLVVDFIADYYTNIEKYNVLSQVKPGYLRFTQPERPPHLPESLETILEDVKKEIIPGMTHWLSPSFFAFFPASVSTASFAGEMLCTGFNSVGFNWLASPAATELEMLVMDWLAHMLTLPSSFTFSRGSGGGVIQSTTSESILCTLVAARDSLLDPPGVCTIADLVVYASDQTHTTFAKACKIAGILPQNIRSLPTTIESEFSLSPELLSAAMDADTAQGLVPLYVCANIGTTSTTAVDPLRKIVEVAGEYGAWVHVDAAYAGAACICPEFRGFLDGVERVDSLSFSPQKWLLSHVDCCCMWVRKPGKLVRALKTSPEYMRNRYSDTRSVVDYQDWQIGSGRRFKALRLWMVLRSYGVGGLQEHIRSDVRMASAFEGMVRSDKRFEVVVPRRFSLVCFRLRVGGEGEDEVGEINKRLLEVVNSTGRVYMTHTVTGGVYMLRFAVGGTLTEYRHVRDAWELIKEAADGLLPTAAFTAVVTAAVEALHLGKQEKREACPLPPPIHGGAGW